MMNDTPNTKEIAIILRFSDSSVANLNVNETVSVAALKEICVTREIRPIRHLTSFGITHGDNTTLGELASCDARPVELFVDGEDTPTTSQRALEYEDINNSLEQQLNEKMKSAWEQFEHCTCNLLAYVSQAYPEGTPDLFNACLRRIDAIQKNPSTISDTAEQIIGYDDACGDCSAFHYKFVNDIQQVESLAMLQFSFHVGHQHTMLTATNVDGTLFLIDIGVNRHVMRFSPYHPVFVRLPMFGGKFGDIDTSASHPKGANRFETMEKVDIQGVCEKVIVPRGKGNKKSYFLFLRRKWTAYSSLLSIAAQSTRSIRIITYTDESCNLFDGNSASVQTFTERDPDKWQVGKETLENIIGEAEANKSVVYVALRRVMALIL